MDRWLLAFGFGGFEPFLPGLVVDGALRFGVGVVGSHFENVKIGPDGIECLER